MPTDVQLTGTPIEMEINGKSLKAKTLTDRDHIELSRFVQQEIISSAIEATKDLPKLEREGIVTSTITRVAGINWYDDAAQQILSGVRGTSRIGWQMVKNQHEITFDDFVELVQANGNIEKMLKSLREIERIYVELNVPPEAQSIYDEAMQSKEKSTNNKEKN